jgi:hypothetical protein
LKKKSTNFPPDPATRNDPEDEDDDLIPVIPDLEDDPEDDITNQVRIERTLEFRILGYYYATIADMSDSFQYI